MDRLYDSPIPKMSHKHGNATQRRVMQERTRSVCGTQSKQGHENGKQYLEGEVLKEGKLYKFLHEFAAGYTRVKDGKIDMRGDLIRKDDFVDMVLNEAKKEFEIIENLDLEMWDYTLRLFNWKKKWFGGLEVE